MFARYTAAAVAVTALAVIAALDGATAQTASQPPDTMAARVEACTPCHGNKGEGTSDVYFPRLAGKRPVISTTSSSLSAAAGANTRR